MYAVLSCYTTYFNLVIQALDLTFKDLAVITLLLNFLGKSNAETCQSDTYISVHEKGYLC